jgi:hypothetical protein
MIPGSRVIGLVAVVVVGLGAVGRVIGLGVVGGVKSDDGSGTLLAEDVLDLGGPVIGLRVGEVKSDDRSGTLLAEDVLDLGGPVIGRRVGEVKSDDSSGTLLAEDLLELGDPTAEWKLSTEEDRLESDFPTSVSKVGLSWE